MREDMDVGEQLIINVTEVEVIDHGHSLAIPHKVPRSAVGDHDSCVFHGLVGLFDEWSMRA